MKAAASPAAGTNAPTNWLVELMLVCWLCPMALPTSDMAFHA
jgi:hypothetical protein